jgi:hypothetical protein
LSKNSQSVTPSSYPAGQKNIPKKKCLLKNFGNELALFINLHGISELLLLVTVNIYSLLGSNTVQASGSEPTFQKYLRNRVFTYSEDGGNKFYETAVRFCQTTRQRIPKIFGALKAHF